MKYIKGLDLFKRKKKDLVGDNVLKTKDISNINLEDIEDSFIMETNGKVSMSKRIQIIGDIGYIPGVYTDCEIVIGNRFCVFDSLSIIRKTKVRDGIVIKVDFENIQYEKKEMFKRYIPDMDDSSIWPFEDEVDKKRDNEIIHTSEKVVKKYKNTELHGITKTYNNNTKELQYQISITAKLV